MVASGEVGKDSKLKFYPFECLSQPDSNCMGYLMLRLLRLWQDGFVEPLNNFYGPD